MKNIILGFFITFLSTSSFTLAATFIGKSENGDACQIEIQQEDTGAITAVSYSGSYESSEKTPLLNAFLKPFLNAGALATVILTPAKKDDVDWEAIDDYAKTSTRIRHGKFIVQDLVLGAAGPNGACYSNFGDCNMLSNTYFSFSKDTEGNITRVRLISRKDLNALQGQPLYVDGECRNLVIQN